MENKNESGTSVGGKLKEILSDKPIWVSWIVYTVISGIIFGILYAAVRLLSLRWWVAVIVIILTGIIWGTLAKGKKTPDEKIEN